MFVPISCDYFLFLGGGAGGGGGGGGSGGVIHSSPAKVRSSVQAKTEQKLNVLMALQGPNLSLYES